MVEFKSNQGQETSMFNCHGELDMNNYKYHASLAHPVLLVRAHLCMHGNRKAEYFLLYTISSSHGTGEVGNDSDMVLLAFFTTREFSFPGGRDSTLQGKRWCEMSEICIPHVWPNKPYQLIEQKMKQKVEEEISQIIPVFIYDGPLLQKRSSAASSSFADTWHKSTICHQQCWWSIQSHWEHALVHHPAR